MDNQLNRAGQNVAAGIESRHVGIGQDIDEGDLLGRDGADEDESR